MAHGLARAGERVTVISLAEGAETVTRTGGVEVHRIRPAHNLSRWRLLWRLAPYWPAFAWAAARRLKAIHRDTPVDVVEAAEYGADSLFVPLLRRRPALVVRLHLARFFVDPLNGLRPDRKKRFACRREAWAIRSADLVTAPCAAVVALTDSWVPLRDRPVRVVPNPVNSNAYCPLPAARAPEVLVAGRLEPRKGILVLASAIPTILRRHPTASFRLVGSDGADATGRSWREHILSGLSVEEAQRVRFGRLTREELINHYRRAAVCVLPSLLENFPYAVLEPMACGAAVIGTRVGGVPEMIEDGVSGLLVNPGDPEDLAERIGTLLAAPALGERLGQAARQRVEERFSVDRVVPEMLEVYRSLARRTQPH
jgi:glycosyltransferase involved in cell wall biosynthesis